jgi:anti-sigma B factor antagonist
MSDISRPSRAAERRSGRAQAPQEFDWSADGSSLLAHGAIDSRTEIDASYDFAAPSAAPFEVRVRPDRERVVVELSGELDIATIPQFREQCDELLGAGFRHVVVDLRELAFLDSTGLHLLIELYARARRDGWELSVIPGSGAVHRVFVVSGTVELLPFMSAADLRARRT